MSVFLVFDVECLAANVWSSVSFVIANRSGRVLETAEFFAETTEKATGATADFWKRHPDAHAYNIQQSRGRNREDEERNLCVFVQSVKDKYNYIALSDTPEFDARIINNILIAHNHTTLSQRDSNTYFQCLCAWSFRLAVAKIYNISGKRLRKYLRYHTETVHGGIYAHTSLFDSYTILYDHLSLLDFIDCVKTTVPFL